MNYDLKVGNSYSNLNEYHIISPQLQKRLFSRSYPVFLFLTQILRKKAAKQSQQEANLLR